MNFIKSHKRRNCIKDALGKPDNYIHMKKAKIDNDMKSSNDDQLFEHLNSMTEKYRINMIEKSTHSSTVALSLSPFYRSISAFIANDTPLQWPVPLNQSSAF